MCGLLSKFCNYTEGESTVGDHPIDIDHVVVDIGGMNIYSAFSRELNE